MIERRRRRGFAVLLVMLSIGLTAVLATGALRMARQSIAMSQALRLQTEGAIAADAAIRLAAARLVVAPIGYDELRRQTLDWRGWRVRVAIEDEGGKIDINRGGAGLLAAALSGFPRAANHMAVIEERGQRRFVSVDELAGELGLDGFDTIRLRRWLTVHGDEILDRRAAAQDLIRLLGRQSISGGPIIDGGARSRLETYTIAAVAERDGYIVRRAAIVRLTPGFADPFEWLEQAASVPPPS